MTVHRHGFNRFPLLLLAGLLAMPAAGLTAGERQKSFTITRLTAPPVIDGRLDDPCWQGIEPAGDFIQHDPDNGRPASEETQVRMGYDQKNIYFAFLLKDSKPDRIWAELTPRNEFENNDTISVILDTYNDQRTSFTFSVNPRGVQSNSVETIWYSEARRLPEGWSAEIAIPFKSLRFSSASEQVWGVNFERFIPRLNETDFWTLVDRDRPLLQQMGELRGLTGIRPGYNLEFFPYAGYRLSRWEGEKDDKLAAGLDFKYGIRPNLILDLTVSPDFSEVESDPFIYQLSPYENYLQERRPFFSEGSQYFETTTGHHGFGPGISLFYSRRISNPKFAAKITGKEGGFSFGMLGALNDYGEDGQESRAPFSAIRVQKDIFSNSQIGFFFTSVHREEYSNKNVAVDYNFRFHDIYTITGFHALTYNSDLPGEQNGAHNFRVGRDPDAGWQAAFSLDRVEDNVRVRTGYVSRTDTQNMNANLGYAWRFEEGWIKRISIGNESTLHQDTHGNITGQSFAFSTFWELRPRVDLDFMADFGQHRFQVLSPSGKLTWSQNLMDTVSLWGGMEWERGGFFKELDFRFSWEKTGVYLDDFETVAPGKQMELGGEMVLRPRSNIEVSLESEWVRQTLISNGERLFSGMTWLAGLHYQFTRKLFANVRLQGETREDQYSLDTVLGYYFGANNIAQFVFKKSSRKEEFQHESGYSFTFKFSYLFRL